MSGAPDMSQLWSLREDVHVEGEPGSEAVVLHSRWGSYTLARPVPVVREALRRMTFGPIRLENVTCDPTERAAIGAILDRFAHLVVRSVATGADRLLMSVVPIAPEARIRPVDPAGPLGVPDDARPVRLSRFAMQRTDGDSYRLESPLSLHRVILHDAAAVRVMAALGRPVRPSALRAPEISVGELLGHLVAAGMVVVAETPGEDGRAVFAEDMEPALRRWRPLDLMFHVSTSLGRHDEEFGMTYRLEEDASAEPVVLPPRDGPIVDLYRPRPADLLSTDPPFTAVLEGRRRLGRLGRSAPTTRQVAELLYRTARVRSLYEESRTGHPRVMVSDRPYPTSGSCYPFEIYVAVHACVGLPRGVYHYDPLSHRLETIPAEHAGMDELMESGRVGAGLTETPPLLLVITARFGRLTWKYNGLSYVLLLKDLGHFLESTLLTCAAMGLASGTVASPDIMLGARVLGTDWRAEPSVAGLVVGVPETWDPAADQEHVANDAEWVDESAAILRRHTLPTSPRGAPKVS